MTDYQQFKETVWDYYHDHGRDLPWRHMEIDGTLDPYKIMVSEIMLQQTQATRVIPKYYEFLSLFPTIEALAKAHLSDVLGAWSGLGYNRRAKFLWNATQAVNGSFPDSIEELVKLPGIGSNTAGAIMAYSFNQPVVFIETNIRTVYIHHFFSDRTDVRDTEITELVADTMDSEHPREWYWALMDYGVHLKSTVGNASRNSKHYLKQSKFEGSKRQIRGQVVKLLQNNPMSFNELSTHIADERLNSVLDDLSKEALIQKNGHLYCL